MQVTTTKICNFLKKISIFSVLLACSAAAFCASDKKWTLAAEQFEFTQNTNNSKAAVSYAKTMPSLIMEQMAEKQGVNENLKRKDQMKWVRLMNNIKVSAEEIVLKERVYM